MNDPLLMLQLNMQAILPQTVLVLFPDRPPAFTRLR